MLSVVPDMESKETLAEYVKRVRLDKRLSLADVERNSRRSGPGISNAYVSQIENGQMTNPTIDALIGLAKGLEVSEDELFAVARGKNPADPAVEHTRLVEMYDDIPAQCQKDVMDLLTVLQHNHSLSARRQRLAEHREDATRRREVAASSGSKYPRPRPPGPIPVADPVHGPARAEEVSERQGDSLPAAKRNGT